MGGTNETKINGLRWHVSSGQVHVHDDSSGIKFTAPSNSFKKDVEGAFKDLERKDGAVSITGDSDVYLVLIKNGDDVGMALYKEGGGLQTQLKDFLKGV